MFNLIKPALNDTQHEWLPEFWKLRLEFLKSKGYEVTEPQTCWPRKFVQCPKTHQDTAQSFILIAKRLHRDERVMIERLGTESETLAVQTTLPKDPRNHCVPVFETWLDPLEPAWTYVVTPVRERHIPAALRRIKDVVLLLDHTLEGLTFLHEHGVSRCRYCTSWQISADSRHWLCEDRRWLRFFRPHPMDPIFYFDSVCHPLAEVGEDTRDDPHPRSNHQMAESYMRSDVANLALTIRECTCLRISNIDFVIPLLRAMSNNDVDAKGALEMWQGIRAQLTPQDMNKTLVYGSHSSLELPGALREDRSNAKDL